MSDALKYGLIPNNPAKAAHNSQQLARWRGDTRQLYWPHVCDRTQPDFCFYYLAEGIKLRNGERWEGNGIYTQLYFEKPLDNTLITLADHSSLRGLALIHYGAFRAGQQRIGYGVADGVQLGQRNARRWTLENVLVSWCEDAIRLTNTWIGTIRDSYISWCGNGIHVPIGCQAIAINVSGGEIGGQNNGYGVLMAGIPVDFAFRSVTIEANKLGGVLHTGLNAKCNTIYDGCYFESNGHAGPSGSEITGKPRQFVIDSANDIGTKILGCGFHDPGVPSIGITAGLRPVVRDNWYEVSPVQVIVGKNVRDPSVTGGTVKFAGRESVSYEG